MDDPTILAHELTLFGRCIISIWHVDPESDGTDDSCGWFSPKLSERDTKIVNEIARLDESERYYSSPNLPLTIVNPRYNYSQATAGDTLAHVAAAWSSIAWLRDRRDSLSAEEWWTVVDLSANPVDNLRASLGSIRRSNESLKSRSFIHCVMCAYLRHHRPWYRHPRWHVHHWSLQIHAVQNLKRWLFSRCAGCGKRFPYGYAPIALNCDGKGPRWFRSEEQKYHHECLTTALLTKKLVADFEEAAGSFVDCAREHADKIEAQRNLDRPDSI